MTDAPTDPVRGSSTHLPTATLDEVDIRGELTTRASRPLAPEQQERALARLAKTMAEDPRMMLQELVETAVELFGAHTAGISLLEDDVFRWEAVAGVFASSRNGTMPREASPCGTCIDRDATQLMHLADRCFPALSATPRFIEALLVPFHEHGKPIGTVWMVSHDTVRKFDREDERILRVLSHFASAGWQLWRACEAASAQNRRKDEWIAMLGHELRNPLAAISSASLVLQNRTTSEGVRIRAAEVVGRQTEHLARMVEDLLDVARIQTGKLQCSMQSLELRDVLTDAVNNTSAVMAGRGHRLSLDIHPISIRLSGDRVRLTQLLSNLLDNASKFTPKGGDIRLSAEGLVHEIRIDVRDTGVGIPKEKFERVFEPFTQLDEPLEMATRGLGLGLTLVRSIVQLHGGSVEVSSAGLGAGSCFTVRLPKAREAQEEARATETLEGAVLALSRRILVVEDNVDVAEVLKMFLSLEGHLVAVAVNGAEALAMVATFSPDVIFLDVGLPGVNGYEIARTIRELAKRPDLMVATMSGYGREEDHRRSRDAGCDEHLVKPVSQSIIRAFLHSTAHPRGVC